MAFHAHSGWCFERLADGSVRMTRRVPVFDDLDAPVRGGRAVVEDVVFDPGTWASIVASVTAMGETTESFRAVQAIHATTGVTVTASS